MNRLYRAQCCLFESLLAFHNEDLLAQYGDEIRLLFRDELSDAWQRGPASIFRVWLDILAETITLTAPRYAARLRIVLAAGMLTCSLALATTLGFCTLKDSPIVHAYSQAASAPQAFSPGETSGGLVQLPDGHRMSLECSGDPNAVPTVILATGRGLGAADAWALVQKQVPPSIRTCSYDAIGAGRSDHVQDPHPESRPIDQVVAEMHGLFQAAGLKHPYVLVGASAGGILVRRYQQKYPHEVAGLVFVDSSHEEMEWRDAAISAQIDPNWNNPAFLQENGFLPDHQKLTWRANIPLIVLERTEKPPPSAFPGLTEQQIDAINAEWHNFQVDLAGRSKYGELRLVTGSGHFMHQQRPDAIAEAIRDVVRQVRSQPR
jgi:pimeloyl-ACP methyl ester carboxylesterase